MRSRPYTNPTPALAASLRHTITAERQNRAVVLRKVNILAAAPTDRHVSGASRSTSSNNIPERPSSADMKSRRQLCYVRSLFKSAPNAPEPAYSVPPLSAVRGGQLLGLAALFRLRNPSLPDNRLFGSASEERGVRMHLTSHWHPHPARGELLAATPTAFHQRSRRPPTRSLPVPPSSVHVVGGRGPLRAYREVRAHIAPGEMFAATPTAFHLRPSRESTLNLQGPQSSLHVGTRRPLRAYSEVACIAPGGSAPRAQAPRQPMLSMPVNRFQGDRLPLVNPSRLSRSNLTVDVSE